ncbi:DUF1360 domain-containing protein [Streptomyces aurantiogriseus]|uniref:Membrane protein n=1 Tax=Streptomyces aurantiogriseus TaxID=66870 RepID=A0A918FMJ2_9ACTN|nr:DUF1360 domain-containing protein [Streptomyces aurantiogriseus]GGR55045.1 membrane protein [Streptomyces aurantiogriseus]
MAADAARYEDRDDDRNDDRSTEPLEGYTLLAAAFTTGAAVFTGVARSRGVQLPQRVPPWDVALLGTATYKASRLLSRDKITSFVRAPFTRRRSDAPAGEVMDEPRGSGVQRAVGDLVSCPFCTSVWVAGALVCSYAWTPRATRLVCAGLGAVTLADWLQYAWTRTQQTTEE